MKQIFGPTETPGEQYLVSRVASDKIRQLLKNQKWPHEPHSIASLAAMKLLGICEGVLSPRSCFET